MVTRILDESPILILIAFFLVLFLSLKGMGTENPVRVIDYKSSDSTFVIETDGDIKNDLVIITVGFEAKKVISQKNFTSYLITIDGWEIGKSVIIRNRRTGENIQKLFRTPPKKYLTLIDL